MCFTSDMNSRLLTLSYLMLAVSSVSAQTQAKSTTHLRLQIEGPGNQIIDTAGLISKTPGLKTSEAFDLTSPIIKTQINPPPAPPPTPCRASKAMLQAVGKTVISDPSANQSIRLEITGSPTNIRAMAAHAIRTKGCPACDVTIGPVPAPPPAPACSTVNLNVK
jgi:hypothetical protein